LDVVCAAVGVSDYVDSLAGADAQRCAKSDVGMADSDGVHSVRCVVGGVCSERRGHDKESGSGKSGTRRLVPDALSTSDSGVELESITTSFKKSSRKRRGRSAAEGSLSWRENAAPLPESVVSGSTVSVRSAEEAEAARTLALRRVAENRVATKLAEHRLATLSDVSRTEALVALQVAKVQERINTTRAKSQASFKKCGSPVESVGSAMSAGEYAFKQEVKKNEALQGEVDYTNRQLETFYSMASDAAKRAVAELEPAGVTLQDLADADAHSLNFSYDEVDEEPRFMSALDDTGSVASFDVNAGCDVSKYTPAQLRAKLIALELAERKEAGM